jgi:hypothetical protein
VILPVITTLNVTVEWLALPLRIREIPGSDLGSEAGYLDFRWPILTGLPTNSTLS